MVAVVESLAGSWVSFTSRRIVVKIRAEASGYGYMGCHFRLVLLLRGLADFTRYTNTKLAS